MAEFGDCGRQKASGAGTLSLDDGDDADADDDDIHSPYLHPPCQSLAGAGCKNKQENETRLAPSKNEIRNKNQTRTIYN